MSLWREYRKSNEATTKWWGCEDKQAEAIAEGDAYHMTIFATDIVPGSEKEAYKDARYFGDLIIDIDHSADENTTTEEALQQSISSANLLVECLVEKVSDIDQIKIYATGKKGFHIIIPWKLLHTSRTPTPHKDIPIWYKYITQRLQIESGATGIDYHLYSKGRGHMIRMPNKKREEGTYKVQVSASELKAMDVDAYQQFVNAPRPALKGAVPTISFGLVGLLNAARTLPTNTPTQEGGIPEEMLEGFGKDAHPECVNRMIHGKHDQPGIKFNSIAVQLSTYLNAAKVDAAERKILVETFATHNTSSTYRTVDARVRHLEIESAPYAKDLKFSCGYIRGHINMKDGCRGCPVQMRMSEDLTLLTRISETDEGLIFTSDEGVVRRLTNFRIDLTEVWSPKDHEGRTNNMWYGGKCSITKDGAWQADIELDVKTFLSAKDFKEQFFKYRDGVTSIKDNDVEAIMLFLLGKVKGDTGVRLTDKVGIRKFRYQAEGATDFVDSMMWVEPGWSLSKEGFTGGVALEGHIEAVIKHEKRELPKHPEAGMTNTLLNVLKSSDPHVVGLMLGWVCAAQIKEQIFDRVLEFPLLNVVGMSGAGKSSLTRVFAFLGGADYRVSTPPTVGGMSPWPIKEMMFQSTSVPRILDECCKGKMNHARWNIVREALKACYQQSTMMVGGVDKNKQMHTAHSVKSTKYKYTSPVIYMSTTETDEVELWERSIEVRITKSMQDKDDRAERFTSVINYPQQWENLASWSRVIIKQALNVNAEQSYDEYDQIRQKLNGSFDMRVRNAFAWVFHGLNFMRVVLINLGHEENSDLVRELDLITAETWAWLDSNRVAIHRAKTRTEVDNFFEKLVQTISRIDHNGNPGLRSGVHYMRVAHLLYLNVEASLVEYRSTCRIMGALPEYSSTQQIKIAIKDQAYFLGEEWVPDALSGVSHPWLKFDIRLLEERGNVFSRFMQD